ncbi:MAG: lysophospholipid acyltransferase family protein [Candidatus Sulfotelmatobacter sp.]
MCKEVIFDENQGLAFSKMTASPKPDQAFWAPPAGAAAFETFCRVFFTCYCPLRVEGRHHLPDGPFLLCSNHASHADSAALMTASGRSFRSFALIGASDYFFQSRSLRWLVSRWMNVIPIDRQPRAKSLAACMDSGRQFLRQSGGALILYPEGSRSPDGEMRPFKPGAGLFALELGVPIVPAYIEGTHRILPKGKSMPRFGPVTVRFGEALAVAHQSRPGKPLREQRRSVVEKLAKSIRMLSSEYQVNELMVGARGKG